MNLVNETKLIMQNYNIHPNKNLGQNFLINEEALNLIAKNVNENDTIIEIGPGLGTLTNILLQKAKQVICIELDFKMCEILEDRFKQNEKFQLLNQDILEIDLNKIAKNAKVVANLPYYITTSIITKLLKEDIKDITILIQKEVADRICAIPGTKEAGAITYFVNYYADTKIIGKVSKESFIPNPKVESEIVTLKKLDKPRVNVNNEELFFKLIKANFSKRRKTILNSLSDIAEKGKLQKVLKELNIKEQTRGETLSLQTFADIANKL